MITDTCCTCKGLWNDNWCFKNKILKKLFETVIKKCSNAKNSTRKNLAFCIVNPVPLGSLNQGRCEEQCIKKALEKEQILIFG